MILDRGTGGLREPSVVDVSQILTLSKNDLVEQIGELGSAEVSLVEAGLRKVLV